MIPPAPPVKVDRVLREGDHPDWGLPNAVIVAIVATLFATINIAGGFLVTQRMLKMFQQGAPSEKASAGGHR